MAHPKESIDFRKGANRTSAFLCTLDLTDPVAVIFLKSIREYTKLQNTTIPAGRKRRVCVKARLGKNSPFRHLYKTRSAAQSIKLEHGAYFDVYIQNRRPFS